MQRCRIGLALVVLLLVPVAAQSQIIIFPGFDLQRTQGTVTWNFVGTPIPADFFGPGSDPFVGNVDFTSDPLATSIYVPPTSLGIADIIIERQATANFPSVPSSVTVPIEIVELSLVSVNPIVVTYNGGMNPEPWDVHLDLSPTPSGSGTADMTRTQPNGGTADLTIPINPLFTFTRQSDNQTEQLDGAFGGYNDVWQANGVPWQAPAPGLQCFEFALSYNGGPQPSVFNGSKSLVPFTNGCLSASGIPTLSGWGTIVLALTLMLLGVGVLVRRRAISRV